MKTVTLHNKKNKIQLLEDLKNENFARITFSFYKYIKIKKIKDVRDELFIEFNKMKILGRIYIAEEGINAQISVPENKIIIFREYIKNNKLFKNIDIKNAVEEGLSFFKLIIKIKKEIVAFNISKKEYNMNIVGQHLSYKEFHDAISKDATVIDMRNYYEGEVGKFENAIIPDVDKSKDLLPEVKKILKGKEKEKILLYCTGGIRCEKASSYLIHHGFKDVNQLDGGIVKYANDIKKNKIKSKFIGKNFVFDNRLGETITEDIISSCHQCSSPSNQHTNCSNKSCNILFIQCSECNRKYKNCCSKKCLDFSSLPIDIQKRKFKSGKIKFSAQYSNDVKPKLLKN